jgi:hypothetical protein
MPDGRRYFAVRTATGRFVRPIWPTRSAILAKTLQEAVRETDFGNLSRTADKPNVRLGG